MYLILSRVRQGMIGFSIFCGLWLFGTADQSINITRADSGVNQSTIQTQTDTTNNQEIVIAILDSGFGTDEIDLSAYPLWENQAEVDGMAGVDDDENGFIDDFHGWDWIDNDNVMNDELGHGTVVSKAIADLVEEISGDRNAVRLMPLRILKSDGRGEISDLVDALTYALRQGVQVANLSFVSYYNSPSLMEAIKIADSEGLLMVASTRSLSSPRARTYWPAAYPETLAVDAVPRDNKIDFCRAKSETDIAIFVEADDSTSVNDDIPLNVELHVAPASGQSSEWSSYEARGSVYATPYFTAITVLALAQNPELSRDEIRATVRAENSCNGLPDGIRSLEIEELATVLQAPTAILETVEPDEYKHYLPLIAK